MVAEAGSDGQRGKLRSVGTFGAAGSFTKASGAVLPLRIC